MCGQGGIIFGRKRRRPDERDYLREVLIHMLLHSEERGPHASVLAWLKTDGGHRVFKRPMRAHDLVYENPFQELLGRSTTRAPSSWGIPAGAPGATSSATATIIPFGPESTSALTTAPSQRRFSDPRGAGRTDPSERKRTAVPLADARRQQERGTPRFGYPTGDWVLIHGELVTLTDPQRDTHRPTGRLPARGHSMYQRVMMVAARGSIACAVWTYTMYAPQNGHRITNDNQAVFWKSRH
jgi:hypothetical protein